MNTRTNILGQPIGEPVPNWKLVSPPPRTVMEGQYCRIEPIDIACHGAELYAAFRQDRENRIWTYLPYGPFDKEADFIAWMTQTCLGDDPLFHTIIDRRTNKAAGVASYLRISCAAGSIEVGHINFAPALQRTRAATEAMFLMMQRVFAELGYRRYEWKCDSLNAPSRKAAERLGFSFEGIFRQATVYKGRNRDTAWLSIPDREWPLLNRAYAAWLDPGNFDEDGEQKDNLAKIITACRETA
ncbi:MAG: GNAT family N-acetyltransferase [Fimbriimonadaceae bacterium]|nr:GNAT family N-acetyltransferase [Alphaproteobacteria bacterium]